MDRGDLTRADRRLLSEMADDGVAIDADAELWPLILDELGYARRPPQFERRTPLYGAMVVPDDRSMIAAGELVELVPMDTLSLDAARRFADGRSTYLVRQLNGATVLATFRRNVQYEADLVEIQDDSGAFIVQRTPVLGVTRLFTPANTIEWTGYRWTARPNARTQHERLRLYLPQVPSPVLAGLLELAVHWLSPARAGATLVLPGEQGEAGLDLQHSMVPPPLSVKVRHHYPALLAALSQTDLATLIDPTGAVRRLGVGLQSSAEADAAVGSLRRGDADGDRTWGMRHRSAARYTYDQPGALAVVVSDDGPVTVFARGKPLSECAAGLVPAAVTAGAATAGAR